MERGNSNCTPVQLECTLPCALRRQISFILPFYNIFRTTSFYHALFFVPLVRRISFISRASGRISLSCVLYICCSVLTKAPNFCCCFFWLFFYCCFFVYKKNRQRYQFDTPGTQYKRDNTSFQATCQSGSAVEHCEQLSIVLQDGRPLPELMHAVSNNRKDSDIQFLSLWWRCFLKDAKPKRVY